MTLIYLDAEKHYLSYVRSIIGTTISPVKYFAHWPTHMLTQLRENIKSYQQLFKENQRFKNEQQILNANQQRLSALQYENDQLRELLGTTIRAHYRFLIAELLEVKSHPFIQQLTINQGSRAQVFVGQPVIDAYGVVGQISEVNSISSEVLLLTDSRSAVPIEVARNHLRAVLIGRGMMNELELANVVKTADIQVGDVLYTSGVGGHFPFGYRVGTVSHVDKNSNENFAKITVSPSANLDKLHFVLLLWLQSSSSR